MSPALLAAVSAALAYGGGSVLQAVGASRAATAGHGVLGVTRQWPYLAGLGLDLAGWLLSLAALRRLPLFAVQAILAGSLAVTVTLAGVVLGLRPRRTDRVAILAIFAALVVLGLAAGVERSRPLERGVEMGLLVGVVVVVGTGAAAARWLCPVATGAVAGLAFGGAALCARAVPEQRLLSQPLVYALLVYGLTGMLAYAHALERGNVGSVTAALWVSEIVVPAAVGAAVLGDHTRPGWAPAAVLASGVAVFATIVLATSPAQSGPDQRNARFLRSGGSAGSPHAST